jgi:hypothetical protein
MACVRINVVRVIVGDILCINIAVVVPGVGIYMPLQKRKCRTFILLIVSYHISKFHMAMIACYVVLSRSTCDIWVYPLSNNDRVFH